MYHAILSLVLFLCEADDDLRSSPLLCLEKKARKEGYVRTYRIRRLEISCHQSCPQ